MVMPKKTQSYVNLKKLIKSNGHNPLGKRIGLPKNSILTKNLSENKQLRPNVNLNEEVNLVRLPNN